MKTRLHKSWPHFLSPAILPGDPFHAVPGVTQPVAAGELLAVAVGMTTLGADQSQEVEFV